MSTRANRQVADILVTILVIVHQTKHIFELGREFDLSKPNMKFEKKCVIND